MERRSKSDTLAQMAEALGEILHLAGWVDWEIDSDLKDTPKRFSKMLREYSSPKPFSFTVFPAQTKGMIVLAEIPFASLCAHHLAPFSGTATVGYLPHLFQAGLSKLPRTVNFFAHRLQNQERLTEQIAEHLRVHLRTEDVGVILKGEHTCMSNRGVRAHGVITTTTRLSGRIESDPQTRAEFLAHHNYH